MEKRGYKRIEIEVYVNGGWKKFSAILSVRDTELFEKLKDGESRLIGDEDGEEVFARIQRPKNRNLP